MHLWYHNTGLGDPVHLLLVTITILEEKHAADYCGLLSHAESDVVRHQPLTSSGGSMEYSQGE